MNKDRSRADARRGCRSRHPSAGAHPRAPRAHPGWTMMIVQPNPASTTAPRPGPFGGRGTTADARSGCKPVPLQPLGLAPTHNRADASCAIRQSCYVGSPRTPRLAAATPRPSAASATDLTPRRTGQWACVSQRRPLRPPPPPPSQTAAVLSWAKSRLTYGLPIRQSGDPEETTTQGSPASASQPACPAVTTRIADPRGVSTSRRRTVAPSPTPLPTQSLDHEPICFLFSCCHPCCRTTITPRAGRGLGQTAPPVVREGGAGEWEGRCSGGAHTWRSPAATSRARGRASLPHPAPSPSPPPSLHRPSRCDQYLPLSPGIPPPKRRAQRRRCLARARFLYWFVCTAAGCGENVGRVARDGWGSSRARAARRPGG